MYLNKTYLSGPDIYLMIISFNLIFIHITFAYGPTMKKKTDIYIFLISYFMFYIIIIIIIIIIIALDDKRVSKDQISIFLTIPLCVSSVCWLFSISSLNLSCPTHTDTKHLHGFYALTRQNRACQEERQRESLWLILVTLVQIHSGGSLLSSLYFSL